MPTNQSESIYNMYGNRLRVRVCGVCMEGDKILLVKHNGLGELGFCWMPPGGGVEYGGSLESNLAREFKEETGLDVTVGKFLFVHEFLQPPLHAIELFFAVSVTGGTLALGIDPEMDINNQIIDDLRYFSPDDIRKKKKEAFHQIFLKITPGKNILNMQGYFKI